jgi:outer membrane protein assembly factor BamB
MSTSQPFGHPTALRCPSCGAALPEGGQRRECAYCGTTVELPRRSREQKPPAAQPAATPPVLSSSSWSVAVQARPARSVVRPGGCGRVVATLAVITVLAVAVLGALLAFDTPLGLDLRGGMTRLAPLNATGKAALLAGPQAAGSGQVASLVRSGGGDYQVALLDTQNSQRLWVSEPFSSAAISYGQFAANADTVVFADDRTLAALSRADGTRRWSAALSDRVCDGCLQIVGDAVVALSADYTLRSVDMATGETLWTQSLGRSSSQRLLPVDDGVAVFGRAESSASQIQVLDAQTGRERFSLATSCADGLEGQIYTSGSDPYWYSDGILVLYTSSSSSCIHAYDLRAGQQLWSTVLDRERAPLSFLNVSMQLLDGTLYIGGGTSLVATDMQTGETSTVISDPDRAFQLLARHGDDLLLAVTRTIGTRRNELWGVDATSGKQLWKHTFRGDGDLLDEDDAGTISKEEDVWTWAEAGDQFALVTLSSQPNRVTIARLDPHTGQVLGQSGEITLTTNSVFWRPDLLARQGAQLLLEQDSRLVLLDTARGTIAYTGP